MFTKEEVGGLLKNSNVTKCSERSISYSNNFKLQAVKQYNEGTTSREIFERSGFNLNVIGRDTPKDCLRRWNNTHRSKGTLGLGTEARGRGGGRPKTKGVTEHDRIKRLEAEVAYLKAENDFLTKLRAKRAE